MTVDPDLLRAGLLKYLRLAFQLLPPIDAPAVLDAGCGTGVPTMELARLCDGTILAVDTDGAALARLREKIAASGLEGRVRTLQCSYAKLPPQEGPFDLVWAEGSISGLGFDAALGVLGGRLKEGGFLVVHDDEGDCLAKARVAREGGCEVRGLFVLPGSLWWSQYYEPLRAALAGATAVRAPYCLAQQRDEVERVRADLQGYGSAYFILRKRGGDRPASG